jgi:hypothetical protein
VIAYYKGKRWGGKGVSFKGALPPERSSPAGSKGSRETASGSFRC